ncbi:RNA polymerase C [Hanseniaspora valbyensis NRRL Y-1626]|uniref:DNA-directed RNA polymerase subunit n=1 Tax=Hanseniaspora valbyensis NRRL Y-1626 TaxID=766949 RepID=A0A1B7TE34_9ASCO|nr:RNA polymerase C [Hanseniaspora valbyensis NRRL Y-1626]
MFILTKISDLVIIPPEAFNQDPILAIKHEINKKYANKVINRLGLGVSLYDIITMEDGQLKPGDGNSYVQVTFQLIVFKPMLGEIITGFIKSSNMQGIRVTLLPPANNIYIPKEMLFEGCYYSVEEKVWVWNIDGTEETKVFFDLNEKIRFRIEKEIFFDIKPNVKEMEEKERLLEEKGEEAIEAEEANKASNEDDPAPYIILGSCQSDGMGLVAWWEEE